MSVNNNCSMLSIIIEEKPDGTYEVVQAHNVITRRHAEIMIEYLNDNVLHQLDLMSWNLNERAKIYDHR